jgi:hypothetical protein
LPNRLVNEWKLGNFSHNITGLLPLTALMSGDKLILNSSIVRLLITNGEKKIKMYNE